MSFRTGLRQLLRILDYAYLFFALVILSSLLWAGAGLILMGIPVVFLLPAFGVSNATILLAALFYVAVMSGSIGVFWGWKRWRRHLREEAQREAEAALKK